MVLNDFDSYGTEVPDFSGSFYELFNEYNLEGDDAIKLFNCKKDSIELIGIDGNIKDLSKGKLSTLNQNKLSI